MAELGAFVGFTAVPMDEDDPYLVRSVWGLMPPFSAYIKELAAPSRSLPQIEPGETTLSYYKRLLAKRRSRS